MFLMIRNPGVCPKECFTLLGVSTTRYSGSSETIGTFGTGSKHAINLCLKNNVPPVIITDKLRIDPYTKPQSINDGLDDFHFQRVCFKLSGQEGGKQINRTEESGFVLEMGENDWTDFVMGPREFVSNALDRTYRETGSWDSAEFQIVQDKSVRAKSGHTSIFLPLTAEVLKFYNELGKRFLHFSKDWDINNSVMPKADRGLYGSGAMIYKRGVFVRQLDEPSLFDYNLNNLHLDECRTSSEYDVRHYATIALAKSPYLKNILQAIQRGETNYWELNFNEYTLETYADKELVKQYWPAELVPCLTSTSAERIKAKGFQACIVKSNYYSLLQHSTVPVDMNFVPSHLLDKNELPASAEMIDVVNKLWKLLESFQLTQSKHIPQVKAFNPIMDAECKVRGMYLDNVVYLHNMLSGKELTKVALEELTHHITGSTDASRDFQDYLLTLLTEIIT